MLTKYNVIKKKENKNKFDYNLLVDTAILLGEIMLKNGAETFIVEQTMDKLLKTTKMKHVETVVMTTSIVVTLSDPKLDHITAVSRIHERVTNLNRIYEVNNLVEQYCKQVIDLEELFHALKKLKKFNQYSILLKNLALMLIPPAFTIMLNGTWIDAITATICGVVLALFNWLFLFIQTNNFIKNTFVMFITTVISEIFNRLIGSNVDAVIIGVMMPYVPGVAITNAARDALNADYMSGAGRLLDALLQAFAVAIGVFVGMFVSNFILGGR